MQDRRFPGENLLDRQEQELKLPRQPHPAWRNNPSTASYNVSPWPGSIAERSTAYAAHSRDCLPTLADVTWLRDSMQLRLGSYSSFLTQQLRPGISSSRGPMLDIHPARPHPEDPGNPLSCIKGLPGNPRSMHPVASDRY